MNVYVETNFVLELVHHQEQFEACEELLRLASENYIQLLLPSFAIVESFEKVLRQRAIRKRLIAELLQETEQLKRSVSYKNRLEAIGSIKSLLTESNQDDEEQLRLVRKRLLSTAKVLPLTQSLFVEAMNQEQIVGLEIADALIFQFVVSHLSENHFNPSCFLNKNSKHFQIPDVQDVLERYNCKLITQFADGLSYVKSNLK